MKYLAALVFTATACGSSAPGPREIELTVGNVPDEPMQYLVYRDGSGPWQVPATTGDGTYALVVTDTYEVFAAFETPLDYSRYELEEVRATADDPPPTITATVPSGLSVPPARQPQFEVSGRAADDTTIIVETPPDGDISAASPSNGGFVAHAFDTSSYLYALGPYDGTHLATVVRRSFEPGRNTSVGSIDVANEARALPTHPVVIANAMTSGLSKPYAEVDGPGRLSLRPSSPVEGTTFDMPLLPPSMREPGDHYAIAVGTSSDVRAWQNYRNSDAEDVSTIELMSPVAVDLNQYPTSATWAIDDRDAQLDGAGSSVGHHVRATAGWLAATGATSLTMHEDVPAFDPDWRIYATYHVVMSLTLSTSTPTSVNSVTMSN